MKKFQKLFAVILAIWVCTSNITATNADSTSRVTISGHVLGASGAHSIYVMLLDSAGFPMQPVQQLRLPPGADSSFSIKVAPGRWAISAFEDLNDNGKLDIRSFGPPKEPSGFWRPFNAMRKPEFNDVMSQIDSTISGTDVKIRSIK